MASQKSELAPEDFKRFLPELPSGMKALLELVLPLDTHYEPIEDVFILQLRHSARREGVMASTLPAHPFEVEHGLTDEQLCARLEPKAREMIERIPGMLEIENLRVRCTRAVVFWSDGYEVQYNEKKADEDRKWAHDEKLKYLKEKLVRERERVEKQAASEMDVLERQHVEAGKTAYSEGRARLGQQYPEWLRKYQQLEQAEQARVQSVH